MIGLFHILSTHFIRPAAFLYESIRKFFKNSAIGQVYIRYELSRVLWWCAEEDTSLKTTSTLSFNEHFRSLPGQLINLKKKVLAKSYSRHMLQPLLTLYSSVCFWDISRRSLENLQVILHLESIPIQNRKLGLFLFYLMKICIKEACFEFL